MKTKDTARGWARTRPLLWALAVCLPLGTLGQTNYTPYTFTSLAGSVGNAGAGNGIGSAAQFNSPHGVAADRQGNVYVADMDNHTIRKITPGDSGGTVSTLAGLAGSPGNANGTGTVARFRYPSGIAVNSAGDIFVSDECNHAIRKVTTNGVVTTFAGLAGSGNHGFADATGTTARFYNPHGCAVDGADNLCVSEMNNCTVRKITPGGVVTTLAGWPLSVGSANGTGSAVRFSAPRGGQPRKFLSC